MSTKLCKALMVALAYCAVLLPMSAQQQPQPLHLALEKPHQLRDLVVALQMRNWLVTFEEGPVLSARGLETKSTPTGLPLLVKRTVPLTFDVNAEDLSVTSSNARAALLQRLLAAYAKAGYGDSYRVINHGHYLHIVPATINDENGNSKAFDSVLDTTVSFPEQHFNTLYTLVDEILNQVTEKRGVPVVLGNVPNNLFRQTSVVESANDESAREVLARAFAETNGPRLASGLDPVGFAWTLSYDPTDRQYWFSVNPVRLDVTGIGIRKSVSPQSGSNEVHTGIPNGIRKTE